MAAKKFLLTTNLYYIPNYITILVTKNQNPKVKAAMEPKGVTVKK